MSRSDLFFQNFPYKGSVDGRNASEQPIVLITAPPLWSTPANPLISLANKNDKSLKTLDIILRLAVDFVTMNDYILYIG